MLFKLEQTGLLVNCPFSYITTIPLFDPNVKTLIQSILGYGRYTSSDCIHSN